QATTGASSARLERVVSRTQLLAYQGLTRRVPVSEAVAGYAVDLVRATRPGGPGSAEAAGRWLTYGGSVRAAQFLVLAGKARALSRGQVHVGYADIQALARPVLRHRLLRNFQAEAEQVQIGTLIDELLQSVPVPGAPEQPASARSA
ncbi:MAG: AAA family ATPase, partial [Gammaproteobacteria bacterium]|nr:AAA family ATPase [Gammaproteobacteria bacterium]